MIYRLLSFLWIQVPPISLFMGSHTRDLGIVETMLFSLFHSVGFWLPSAIHALHLDLCQRWHSIGFQHSASTFLVSLYMYNMICSSFPIKFNTILFLTDEFKSALSMIRVLVLYSRALDFKQTNHSYFSPPIKLTVICILDSNFQPFNGWQNCKRLNMPQHGHEKMRWMKLSRFWIQKDQRQFSYQ